ncbi:uncharacterized protein AB675_6550 [Cyphellophora attinorum]|uniref:Uncharacterized protein n=1 Tax=Cyphellophora attinorum TaxID=1664694 RepID=A0A0N1HEX6_9EURO|nr:uncharacterized protein AB675_6550 [Phialophora attinorum]KPI44134.1 hypothetical protein AB675_6550 [Phialophora attinorum]
MAQIPITMASDMFNDACPLSKRRKFTPPQFSIIPSETNSDIAHHTFGSPVLAQLSAQAPSQAEIEASLLQVGMRVRKSVADGYQSPQKKPFTPHPFSNRLARLSPETQQALMARSKPVDPEPYSAGSLHKVGGLAMQPTSTATFCGINLAVLSHYSEDRTNEISQQSLWSYTTSSKRGYEGDSDSDESQDWQPDTPTLHPDAGESLPIDYFNIGTEQMVDVSFMQTGNRSQQNARGRKVAQPKSRLRPQRAEMQDMPMPPSVFNPFENFGMQPQSQQFEFVPEKSHCHRRMMSIEVAANMTDFEDASFLQPQGDIDMDCS